LDASANAKLLVVLLDSVLLANNAEFPADIGIYSVGCGLCAIQRGIAFALYIDLIGVECGVALAGTV